MSYILPNNFVGGIGYADDLTLLTPIPYNIHISQHYIISHITNDFLVSVNMVKSHFKWITIDIYIDSMTNVLNV